MIDSHWHLYVPYHEDGTDYRLKLDALQKEQGLNAVNLCCIPCYHELGPAQNILAAIYKLHNPSAYAFGGLVYPQIPFAKPMPQGMDPLSQYEELMAIGFDGIKMLETKPTEQKIYGFCIDDPYFDGFFAAAALDGTPMVWHVADPETFWDINRIPQRFLDRGWFYGDGTYMSYDRVYAQVYNVLDKNPTLKVSFAHFFFLSDHPEQLEALFAKYPGASIDLTPGSEMYASFRENREFYRNFFEKYQDRIIFGTDTSYSGGDMTRFTERSKAVVEFLTTDKDLQIISVPTKGLALSKEITDKILGGNFRRQTGAPKPIDREALRVYAKKYKHLITDETIRNFIFQNI